MKGKTQDQACELIGSILSAAIIFHRKSDHLDFASAAVEPCQESDFIIVSCSSPQEFGSLKHCYLPPAPYSCKYANSFLDLTLSVWELSGLEHRNITRAICKFRKMSHE
ncbi:hypothetical protein O6H91_23G043500 [Diphasiastrum complanatum]|uniref:Uncharacterized protein n=1 Tax=Diphasiastrum complanatum TaxID=34168 RepID=A0ACC2AAG0_DIPCM|nr:hypothetical protein O6H91_23G043500 [Diphasiastrum complanatum]